MSLEPIIYEFIRNLKSKDELKTLFINNYDNSRGSTQDTVGLPLTNTNETICYFISAFNIVSRLQYVIFNEIDKLSDLAPIIVKLNADECLEDAESKKFNKYLLIQTIIEVHAQRITDDRINFIHDRLKQFTFSKNIAGLQNVMMTKIHDELDKLKENLVKLNDLIEVENLVQFGLNLITQINQDINSAYSTGDTTNLYKNFIDVVNEKYKVIKENFNEYYDKWMTEEELNLVVIRVDDPYYDEDNNEKLKKMLQTINLQFNTVDELIRQFTSGDTTIHVLCANSLLQNNFINKAFLKTFFAITIDGNIPGDSMSSIAILALIDCLDTTDVKIISDMGTIESIKANIKEQNIPYVIYNYGELNYLLETDYVNLKNNEDNSYNLVTLSYNCGSKHSVVSTCYGTECTNFKHILINEDTNHALDLKDFNKGTKGKLCVPHTMSLENITFELDSYVKKLSNDIQTYSESKGLTMPAIHGGARDEFKLKYLKYKNKYLMLKQMKK